MRRHISLRRQGFGIGRSGSSGPGIAVGLGAKRGSSWARPRGGPCRGVFAPSRGAIAAGDTPITRRREAAGAGGVRCKRGRIDTPREPSGNRGGRDRRPGAWAVYRRFPLEAAGPVLAASRAAIQGERSRMSARHSDGTALGLSR